MTELKLNEKMLKSTPLGEIIIKARELSKLWSSVGTKLAKCYIVNSNENKLLVDPFLARRVLSDIESDPVISKALGTELLAEIKNNIDGQCKNLEGSFEANLREYCNKHNISIDGRFPKFILEGFLQVVAVQTKGTVKVSTKEIKSLLIEAISLVIVEALDEEAKRVFSASSFLDELYGAYERTVLLERSTSGNPVAIKDLFNELVFVKQPEKFKTNPSKSNYYEYTTEFFLRDLAKLMKSGSNIVKGKRLELVPTSLTDQAFPLLIDGSVRYIGRIAFTEVSK